MIAKQRALFDSFVREAGEGADKARCLRLVADLTGNADAAEKAVSDSSGDIRAALSVYSAANDVEAHDARVRQLFVNHDRLVAKRRLGEVVREIDRVTTNIIAATDRATRDARRRRFGELCDEREALRLRLYGPFGGEFEFERLVAADGGGRRS